MATVLMFIEIQIPLLFPVCSQFLKICNLEQMASVWKQMFIYKNLPFWFLIVIHDSSSIELYQLCVIWWQPMSGLTTAWQQLNGSFMTITAWRWRLPQLMKSSWELGDSWATASWQISWDTDCNCISACVSFVICFFHFSNWQEQCSIWSAVENFQMVFSTWKSRYPRTMIRNLP